MCYSKNLSLTSFIFGITSSFLLINYGNKKNLKSNLVIGYFFMFVSVMQLIEYYIWTDLKCKTGYNKFSAYIGPLFNHLQPIVLLLITRRYLQSNNCISDNIITVLNLAYFMYILHKYIKYINDKNNLCIQLNSERHINWTWKKDFHYGIYIFIELINALNYSNNTNFMISICFSYLLLFISINKFKKNIGEFWCLMVTGVPFVNLFIQNSFNIAD